VGFSDAFRWEELIRTITTTQLFCVSGVVDGMAMLLSSNIIVAGPYMYEVNRAGWWRFL
jgi:hypothetical protein